MRQEEIYKAIDEGHRKLDQVISCSVRTPAEYDHKIYALMEIQYALQELNNMRSNK